MPIKIITLDPAHFHAALIHKEMVPGIEPEVHVFAPLGPDLMAHLNRLMAFNSRPADPTRWDVEVHASADFLKHMLRQPPGNVAVLAGRNHTKIDSMLACAEAGLHILADKPWIIRHADMPKLERLLAVAKSKGVVIFDIMTERHEITSILQRELVLDPEVFGELIPGTPEEPAIEMESIHALKKLVAGTPLMRPPAFFDIQNDIQMISAERWPTVLSRDDYEQITGEKNFPVALGDELDRDHFAYYCNNRAIYVILDHFVLLDIRWDVELAAGDTHFAEYRGTRSAVRISQDPDKVAPPDLDVIPNADGDRSAVRGALEQRVSVLAARCAGLQVADHGQGFRIVIPADLRIGHEAHFAQVASEFLTYVHAPGKMPAWEMPNLLAKYFVTTKAVEMG